MINAFEFQQVLGKTVVALRGIRDRMHTRSKKLERIELRFILFNDNETYIELDEQDYYTYHDCSSSARHIRLYKNPAAWRSLMDCEGDYREANTDF